MPTGLAESTVFNLRTMEDRLGDGDIFVQVEIENDATDFSIYDSRKNSIIVAKELTEKNIGRYEIVITAWEEFGD